MKDEIIQQLEEIATKLYFLGDSPIKDVDDIGEDLSYELKSVIGDISNYLEYSDE